MADTTVAAISGHGRDFWKRSAVLAGSAGLGMVVSDVLVDRFISDDVDDPDTERDEAEMWRGALQIGMGLIAGRVAYKWSRDAAVGLAVGISGKGIYRLADGLGLTAQVEDWLGSGDEGDGEELPETTTTGTTSTSTTAAHGAGRRRMIIGEVLPRVGARR